jgi:uncharacterized LabA/DUF88 family protein
MISTHPKRRVISYVDGFNLYYGLKAKGWKKYYWLNIQEMLRLLLATDQTLVATKYFTSIVDQPPEKNRRQRALLSALETLSDFNIFYGHYIPDKVECFYCGHTYITHHEKMTDVNIAVEMLTDAFEDRFDVALLVSADGDLVRAAERVRRFSPGKHVIVAFPPARKSSALVRACGHPRHIGVGELSKSQFPDEVITAGGFIKWH